VAVLVAALAIPSVDAAGGAAASTAGSGTGRPQAGAVGGTLRAWGLNDFGQLGNDTTISSDTPVKVQLPPGTQVTSMRAGCGHTLALTTTGQVLAWGYNNDGELGDGTTTSTGTPVMVKLPPGTKVKAIRAGCFHSLALTTTGHVLAWGFSGQGELGNGSILSSPEPVMVKLPKGTKVAAISAGAGHSLAVTTTGRLYAWGYNGGGQLGDGTTTNADIPVRVKLPLGAKVTAIAAGCDHNLALTAKGHVLAWGFNHDGELGNGTTINSDLPVRVATPAGLVAIAVAAGPEADHSLTIVHKAKP
jgi:alpha-tubulin suppressor-like RCC1 family protein